MGWDLSQSEVINTIWGCEESEPLGAHPEEIDQKSGYP